MVQIAEFKNTEGASDYIKGEDIWSKCSTKTTLVGEKVEYRCKHSTYGVGECPARIFYLFHATSELVSIYATNSEHFHQKVTNRGLEEEMKDVVKEFCISGVEAKNNTYNLFKTT